MRWDGVSGDHQCLQRTDTQVFVLPFLQGRNPCAAKYEGLEVSHKHLHSMLSEWPFPKSTVQDSHKVRGT